MGKYQLPKSIGPGAQALHLIHFRGLLTCGQFKGKLNNLGVVVIFALKINYVLYFDSLLNKELALLSGLYTKLTI